MLSRQHEEMLDGKYSITLTMRELEMISHNLVTEELREKLQFAEEVTQHNAWETCPAK